MLKNWKLIIPVILILAALILYLGSAPPSPLYYLKISRETVQSFFVFGDEDQTNWLLTKAEKRITEAEKLKAKKINFFAQIQIQSAKTYNSEAQTLINDLKNKTNVTYLVDKHTQNQDRLNQLEN